MSEYDGPCEAGCLSFHGGEKRHHPTCGHYPHSLTKYNDERIKELEAQLEWQPIETAPKDGTKILCSCRGAVFIASWRVPRPQKDGYRANGGRPWWTSYNERKLSPVPTHWKPLPDPPKEIE